MTLVESYTIAVILAVLGWICLGAWPNALKLSRWRFELSYLDVVLGASLAAAALAITFGTFGYDSFTFLDDVMHAGRRNLAYGIAAGAILNLGLMLLVAGMSIIGMTLAFLMGFGLGTGVTVLLAYLASPQGNPVLLSVGAATLLVSIVCSMLTHRLLSLCREFHKMKTGEHRTLRPTVHWKGVILSLAGGVVTAFAQPLVDMAREPEIGVGPYSLAFLIAAGMLGSSGFYELYFLNLPVRGAPLEPTAYLRGSWRQHVYGLLGGGILMVGSALSLILEASPSELSRPRALFFVLRQGAPLLVAAWGLIAWKDFQHADGKTYGYLVAAITLYAAALVLLGVGITPPVA
ncbi:MAG: hypothetical protein ACUVXB_07215 [Bryobacteraceae bacterium]